MKYLYLLFILPSFIFSQTDLNSQELNWLTDYEKAIKESKKENKNVLLYFTGSDWCPPCKMLKEDFFNTQEFALLSKNYVLLYVDMPRNQDLLTAKQMKHNKSVLKQYNGRGVFPLLKVINTKGRIIDEHSGYAMNGDTQYHMKFVQKNQ